MSDFQKQYALWDKFLSVRPASLLATMTLDEYSQAGSKDSFTYWIESHRDDLGSIWASRWRECSRPSLPSTLPGNLGRGSHCTRRLAAWR